MSVQLPCSKIDAGRDPSLRPSESVAVADKLFMGTADLKSKKSLQMLSISRPAWPLKMFDCIKFYLTQRGSPSLETLKQLQQKQSIHLFSFSSASLSTALLPCVGTHVHSSGAQKSGPMAAIGIAGVQTPRREPSIAMASHLLLSITYPRPVRLRLRSDRSAHHTRMVFLWPSTSMREPSKSSTARLAPS